MKRLGLASLFAGILVGQTWNGPTTEAFGVYLLVLAALLISVSLVVRSAR